VNSCILFDADPSTVTIAAIPNRPVFRAQEVCEIAQVQPYVLRSWEAEFPDLGVAKTASGPRVYRRGDVQRVLRLKHLLFVDGLTLAGARKRLHEEGSGPAADDSIADADVAAMLDEATRDGLRDVKRGLQWILGVLSGHGVTPEDRVLIAGPPPARSASRKPAASRHKPAVKRSGRKKR
jgi:DNA-binding transcriptional MerR regulator